MLTAAGKIMGTAIYTSSITIKAPKILPNKRKLNENGLKKYSRILKGSITADGSTKLFIQPENFLKRIPDNKTNEIDINAIHMVTLIFFVGGLSLNQSPGITLNMDSVFDNTRNKSIVPMYAA